jgi:uncharacterized protein GlcG (DUF336 family)
MFRTSQMLKIAAAAGFLAGFAVSAQAQSSGVTSDEAMAAYKAVHAYELKDGSDVSMTVVDRDGQIVLMLRGNTAAPHNLGLSVRKAITANRFKMRSIDWRDKTKPGSPDADQRNTPGAIPLGGGVPIMVGGEVIGAVGVSGTRGGQEGDTAAAQAGADAAAALVKRLQAQARN